VSRSSVIQPLIFALASPIARLLVSTDGGVTFELHPASAELEALFTLDNAPMVFALRQTNPVEFWVAGEKLGLWVYHQNQWLRFGGAPALPCPDLPATATIRALLAADNVLIGTDRSGLWQYNATGCRRVFDGEGRYEILAIQEIATTFARYLLLVRDMQIGEGSALGEEQLYILCPLPASCQGELWEIDRTPLWHENYSIEDFFVQRLPNGEDAWYLASGTGQFWRGKTTGGHERLPGVPRCIIGCEATFAPQASDDTPYLLTGNHIYILQSGDWWRRLWP
jgi:hypothetical protein